MIYDSYKYIKTNAIVINLIDLTNIVNNYIIDIEYYIKGTKYVNKNINLNFDTQIKFKDTIDIYYNKYNYKNIRFKNNFPIGVFILFISIIFFILFSILLFYFV